jgi:hypothetical protein
VNQLKAYQGHLEYGMALDLYLKGVISQYHTLYIEVRSGRRSEVVI